MIEAISPWPDIPDYEGNLPLFYTVKNNDFQMIETYFTKGKSYFGYRNYKYQSIFHIAARHNSFETI